MNAPVINNICVLFNIRFGKPLVVWNKCAYLKYYIQKILFWLEMFLKVCDFIQIMINLPCKFPEISFSIYTDAHSASSSIHDPKVLLIVYSVFQNMLNVCVWSQINNLFLSPLFWSVGCCSVGTLSTSFPVQAV